MRSRERGGVAILLLLLISSVAAMLGALALRGSVTDLRLSGSQRIQKTGFYCAEAGLDAARSYFAANYFSWNAMFGASGVQMPIGYPVTGDLDGDGQADYSVTLIDNFDEFPPMAPNPTLDNDLSAIMVSRCISPTMGQRQLQELVVINQKGINYRMQAGHGSNHAGTEN